MSELSFIIRAIDKTKEGLSSAVKGIKEATTKMGDGFKDVQEKATGLANGIKTRLAGAAQAAAGIISGALVGAVLVLAYAYGAAWQRAQKLRDTADLSPQFRKNVDAMNAMTEGFKGMLKSWSEGFGDWGINFWGGFVRQANIAWEQVKGIRKGFHGFTLGDRGEATKTADEKLRDTARDTTRLEEEYRKNSADQRAYHLSKQPLEEQDRVLRQQEGEKQNEYQKAKEKARKMSDQFGSSSPEYMKAATEANKLQREALELEKQRDRVAQQLVEKKKQEADEARRNKEAKVQQLADEAERVKQNNAIQVAQEDAQFKAWRDKRAIAGANDEMTRIQMAANTFSEDAMGQAGMLRGMAGGKYAEADHFRKRAVDRAFRKEDDDAMAAADKEEARFQSLLSKGKRGIRGKDIREALKADDARKEAVALENAASALEQKAKEAQIKAAEMLEQIQKDLKANLESE